MRGPSALCSLGSSKAQDSRKSASFCPMVSQPEPQSLRTKVKPYFISSLYFNDGVNLTVEDMGVLGRG